jgi:invasion protein IalB
VSGLRAAFCGVLACAVTLVAVGTALAQSGGSSAAKKSAKPPSAAQGAKAQAVANPQGAAAPQAKVVGSFGNWMLLCGQEGDNKTERCSLVLPLVAKETQKLIFRVIVTYGPEGRLVLRVDGPTGIALQRGIEFSPDMRKIYRMPFQTCLPMGCKALILVEDDMRKEIANSKEGSITVYALNGKAVKTMTALDGFAAGMKALDKRQKK